MSYVGWNAIECFNETLRLSSDLYEASITSSTLASIGMKLCYRDQIKIFTWSCSHIGADDAAGI